MPPKGQPKFAVTYTCAGACAGVVQGVPMRERDAQDPNWDIHPWSQSNLRGVGSLWCQPPEPGPALLAHTHNTPSSPPSRHASYATSRHAIQPCVRGRAVALALPLAGMRQTVSEVVRAFFDGLAQLRCAMLLACCAR